jgi:hypothetical protein
VAGRRKEVAMKAFLVGAVLAVVLAVAAGFVLEGYFSRDAEQAFSSPSARVGPEGTVEARDFSGGEEEG